MTHQTAADGTDDEALPNSIPHDLEHIEHTPSDVRRQVLRQQLEGFTGHRDPGDIADQIHRMTGAHHD